MRRSTVVFETPRSSAVLATGTPRGSSATVTVIVLLGERDSARPFRTPRALSVCRFWSFDPWSQTHAATGCSPPQGMPDAILHTARRHSASVVDARRLAGDLSASRRALARG